MTCTPPKPGLYFYSRRTAPGQFIKLRMDLPKIGNYVCLVKDFETGSSLHLARRRAWLIGGVHEGQDNHILMSSREMGLINT
jgi:hypothetical protein